MPSGVMNTFPEWKSPWQCFTFSLLYSAGKQSFIFIDETVNLLLHESEI